MDATDKRLLLELQRRGYQSYGIISNNLGISERTLRRRINMMRSDGVIQIIALINPVIAGYRAWAKIGINVHPNALTHVAYQLIKNPSIYFAAYTAGLFDIVIAVQLNSIDTLSRFVNEELIQIDGIKNTETMLMVWPRKYYGFQWPSHIYGKSLAASSIRIDNNLPISKIDETDTEIIRILNIDALTTVKNITAELGLSEITIRKRIKSMLNRNVIRIEVLPNVSGCLEDELWVTVGLHVDNQLTKQTMERLIENPAIYFASFALCRYNIIVSARFSSVREFNEFIGFEMGNMKGINNIEKYLYINLLKYHNAKVEFSFLPPKS